MTIVIPIGKIGSTGEYGRGKLGRYEQAFKRCLADTIIADGPMSLRYLYYRCITGELEFQVAKTYAEYARISDIVVELRRANSLPAGLILDGTRVFNPTAYDEPTNAWNKSDVVPLLICESRSLQGMLLPVGNTYHVGVTALNGQSSETLVEEIRDFIEECPRQVHVFYVGDWDKAGVDIPNSLQSNIQAHVNFTRLAVTPELIEKFNLSKVIPKKPTKEWPLTTEGEALSREQMFELVEDALLEILPEGALEYANQLAYAEEVHYSNLLKWGNIVFERLRVGDTDFANIDWFD